jgi:Arc/MetJ family transcription regulator
MRWLWPDAINEKASIMLDESLVREGMKATGLKTRRALVHHALEELVRRKK